MADNLDVVPAATVSHDLDDGVEAWHVGAASQDADALFRHAYILHTVTTTAATVASLPVSFWSNANSGYVRGNRVYLLPVSDAQGLARRPGS
jgi:hypothetical protein